MFFLILFLLLFYHTGKLKNNLLSGGSEVEAEAAVQQPDTIVFHILAGSNEALDATVQGIEDFISSEFTKEVKKETKNKKQNQKTTKQTKQNKKPMYNFLHNSILFTWHGICNTYTRISIHVKLENKIFFQTT